MMGGLRLQTQVNGDLLEMIGSHSPLWCTGDLIFKISVGRNPCGFDSFLFMETIN